MNSKRFRNWSKIRIAIVTIATILALLPTVAIAAEFVSGDSVIISAPIDDDLYAYGFEIEVNADVSGDVIVAGLAVYINGDVGGSVYAVSATEVIIRGNVGGSVMVSSIQVQILGDVGNSVRVAARSLDIANSAVGKDVVVTASDLFIASDSTVEGDVALSVSSAELLSDIDGSITGQAESAEIGGVVGGSIDLDTTSLRITDTGQVDGDIVVTSDHQPIVERGGTVNGSIERVEPDHPTLGERLGISLVYAVLRFGFALPLGMLAIAIMPDFVRRTSTSLYQGPLASFGWGLLSLIGIPMLILLLMVTVFGIPIAIILSLLFVLALYSSQLVVGLVIGQLIAPKSWRNGQGRGMMVRMLALGLAIVVIARSLPISNWTLITSLFITVFALGAISVTSFKYLRGDREFSAAGPDTPAAAV